MCVSSCRTVTPPLPFCAKAGQWLATVSSSPSRPWSCRNITAGVVARTFVSDATSQIDSVVVGMEDSYVYVPYPRA